MALNMFLNIAEWYEEYQYTILDGSGADFSNSHS